MGGAATALLYCVSAFLTSATLQPAFAFSVRQVTNSRPFDHTAAVWVVGKNDEALLRGVRRRRPRSTTSNVRNLSSSSSSSNDENDASKEEEEEEEFSGYATKVLENITDGELGARGEVYVLAQAILVLGVLFGDVPFVGDALVLAAGPLLFVTGIAVIASGLYELGPALSPYPVVVDRGGGIVASGAFAYVRHPIYAGLLCVAFGWGVWTESVVRLLLTVLLYVCLTLKVEFEEKELLKEFPEAYGDYMSTVPGKMFPDLSTITKTSD